MSCNRGASQSRPAADALGCPALEGLWAKTRRRPAAWRWLLTCQHATETFASPGQEDWCEQCDDWRLIGPEVSDSLGWCEVQLPGTNLSGLSLRQVNLSKANLSGANLETARLVEVKLYRANLSQANLQGADLSRSSFYQANLQGANLARANLQGAFLSEADLSGVNLEGANLGQAIYSKETIWPEGFDPAAAGAFLK